NINKVGSISKDSLTLSGSSRLLPPHPVGGGKSFSFIIADVEPFIISDCSVSQKDQTLKFIDHVDGNGLSAYPPCDGFVHARMPLNDMLPHLSLANIKRIASIHGIKTTTRTTLPHLVTQFASHDCVACNLFVSVFVAVDSRNQKAKQHMKTVYQAKLSNKPPIDLVSHGNTTVPVITQDLPIPVPCATSSGHSPESKQIHPFPPPALTAQLAESFYTECSRGSWLCCLW
ncbi:hypothetical protein Hypma_000100, partial [Hypsizygus marmoreus]